VFGFLYLSLSFTIAITDIVISIIITIAITNNIDITNNTGISITININGTITIVGVKVGQVNASGNFTKCSSTESP
jgi:hypothetical protein